MYGYIQASSQLTNQSINHWNNKSIAIILFIRKTAGITVSKNSHTQEWLEACINQPNPTWQLYWVQTHSCPTLGIPLTLDLHSPWTPILTLGAFTDPTLTLDTLTLETCHVLPLLPRTPSPALILKTCTDTNIYPLPPPPTFADIRCLCWPWTLVLTLGLMVETTKVK